MEILQIVPFLPPTVCGIGDYARLLADTLKQQGVNTRFMVADTEWKGESPLDDYTVNVLSSRSADGIRHLLELLETPHLLLHYVGYGYDLYGCPQWLADGLAQWRGASNERRLTTMFHELYASGRPPWTRAFWSSSRQRRIAADIAKVSDECRTNMRFTARRIEAIASRHQNRVKVAPVFSTVGEPRNILPLSERTPQMAVFGSKGWRQEVYNDHRDELIRACQVLGLKRIVDIGKPVDGELDLPVPVIQTGILPAEEVSRFLSDSRAGFFTYPERFFGKSTIFAAYCAHGLLPVCAGAKQDNEDGLNSNEHFWHLTKEFSWNTPPSPQHVAHAAHTWYANHCLESQAAETKSLLINSPLPGVLASR